MRFYERESESVHGGEHGQELEHAHAHQREREGERAGEREREQEHEQEGGRDAARVPPVHWPTIRQQFQQERERARERERERVAQEREREQERERDAAAPIGPPRPLPAAQERPTHPNGGTRFGEASNPGPAAHAGARTRSRSTLERSKSATSGGESPLNSLSPASSRSVSPRGSGSQSGSDSDTETQPEETPAARRSDSANWRQPRPARHQPAVEREHDPVDQREVHATLQKPASAASEQMTLDGIHLDDYTLQPRQNGTAGAPWSCTQGPS
jgi:hypothetical protein